MVGAILVREHWSMLSPAETSAICFWLTLLNTEMAIVSAVPGGVGAANVDIASSAALRLASVAAGAEARFRGSSFATINPIARRLFEAAVALVRRAGPDESDAVVAAFGDLVAAGTALVYPAGAPPGVSVISS